MTSSHRHAGRYGLKKDGGTIGTYSGYLAYDLIVETQFLKSAIQWKSASSKAEQQSGRAQQEQSHISQDLQETECEGESRKKESSLSHTVALFFLQGATT